ncbi:hypothetical protein SAMN04488543_2341 [Friedmanniella luteola]|uniref:Uncharacterized protein n=1 Tax=Friedmanniella luteola TaxID=546871 RepID=A0A1H1UVY1_9ACTN|nr:hypothetical protein [Friedmanniella luteola]SDS76667.1 hypothetical protein SAMN04488543_2341 [Friedmanniella luteola]
MEGGPEQFDSGPSRVPGRLVGVVVLAVLVVVALVVLDQRRLDRSLPPPPPPTGPATPRGRAAPAVSTTPRPSLAASVTTARGSGPLAAGVPAGRLYARGRDVLYAIDAATGTVVRTRGVELGSTGPVSLVATRRGVLLRPFDTVPGLRVDDGRAPVPLAGALASADEVLPGPDGRLWALDVDGPESRARLVDDRGRPAGPRTRTSGSFLGDGAGGLLLQDVGGVWQVHPGPVRRLTTGAVTAAGPTTLLLHECDARHRCADVLVDRGSGRREPVGSERRGDPPSGTTAPGGAHAALTVSGTDGATRTVVRRLPDGEVVQTLTAPTDRFGLPGSAVWMSSRWLAVTAGARLSLYDTVRDVAVVPDVDLDAVDQLAWRPS